MSDDDPKQIRILTLDDHPLLRQGIAAIIADEADMTIERQEEIVRALTECKGRVGGDDGAAARLGINRTTLLSRMKKLSINARQFS